MSGDFTWRVSDFDGLVGGTHTGGMGWIFRFEYL